MSPSHQRKRRARIVPALALTAIAAVAALAAFVVAPRLNDQSAFGSADVTAPAGADGAATATRGAAATSSAPYTIKPEPTKVATDAPVKTTGGKVDVVLTYAGFDRTAGTVQAGGLVTGVLEDGGTCTLTLTQGAEHVTATSTGAADAASTTCGLLETATGLGAGTWHAVVTYSSADAHGESQAMEVTVP